MIRALIIAVLLTACASVAPQPLGCAPGWEHGPEGVYRTCDGVRSGTGIDCDGEVSCWAGGELLHLARCEGDAPADWPPRVLAHGLCEGAK